MVVYKYWVKSSRAININGEEKKISCFGGSNSSLEDAERKAVEKIFMVEKKIKGDYEAVENYVVEIREEVIEEIDASNVITRNRYGALVLNSADTIILDIDQPKYSFFDFFRSFSLKQKKEKILKQIKKVACKSKYKDLNFRVYETRKGFRVIVGNRRMGAQEDLVKKLFRDFHCDPIYAKLCRKQDCFRARLTPKPSYMKVKGIKVEFPREKGANEELAKWLESYNSRSENYSVCKLVDSIGPRSQETHAIRIHDEMTKVQYTNSLA